LVEAVFFTVRVSLNLNPTDKLYENPATIIAASTRDVFKRAATGDSRETGARDRAIVRTCCI
jgi:hypothetical protein